MALDPADRGVVQGLGRVEAELAAHGRQQISTRSLWTKRPLLLLREIGKAKGNTVEELGLEAGGTERRGKGRLMLQEDNGQFLVSGLTGAWARLVGQGQFLRGRPGAEGGPARKCVLSSTDARSIGSSICRKAAFARAESCSRNSWRLSDTATRGWWRPASAGAYRSFPE